MKHQLAAVSLFAACLSGGAQAAQSYQWNFDGSFSSGSSKTFYSTAGYEPVKVYAMQSNGGGLFTSATLADNPGSGFGIYSYGDSGSPNHAVDNQGRIDVAIFEFDDPNYQPTAFRIGWSNDNTGSGRPDIRAWIGTTNVARASWCFSGCANTLDNLFGPSQLFANVSMNDWEEFNGESGKYLIIAGASGYDRSYDYFKFRSLSGTTVEVPEPGTLSLLGLSLLGFAAARRKAAGA